MNHRPPTASRVLVLPLALALMLAACPGPGRFVWMDKYQEQPQPQDDSYIIRVHDVLNIYVWNQPNLTTRTKVREDGKVSLPLLGDVSAAGFTPPALSQRLQELLRETVVTTAAVTVAVDEARPLLVAVLGEVRDPGMKQLEPGAGLVQALAMAGGFTDYAREDFLFVLRPVPGKSTPERIRFTYRALVQTEGRAASFRLRSGDAVVVE